MSKQFLSVSGVSLLRGSRTLLSQVTFDVREGDVLQLAGSNGTGKTSLMRAIAGLAKLDIEGRIERWVDQLYLGHLSAGKPLLTPRENLCWHPSGQWHPELSAIDAALSAVNLLDFADSPLHTLSAGQQRKVALAGLWLTRAPLWLLDEPFTAIDTMGVQLFEGKIMAHADKGGAVIFTSHQNNRMGNRVKVVDLERFS